MSPVFASAQIAPPLPTALAANANDLQRAVWACEAGAPILAPGPASGVATRFVLGVGGAPAGAERQLTLSGGRLTGVGRLSDASGWSSVRFACALSPGLDRATAFSFEALPAPVAASATDFKVERAANSERMAWSMDGARTLTLSHGVAQTDDRDFRANCERASGAITVALTRTVPSLRAGEFATIAISTGPFSGLYIARGKPDEAVAAVMPVLSLDANDPLFSSVAKGRSLLVNLSGELVYEVSLKGSARAARQFVAACAR